MALRGIVGIEAAIVLIAFVLVASALAFVAINMGMFSAQKSKEVMAKAYDAATHALDIAGNALAYVEGGNVTAILVPLKLTAGTAPIDLNKTTIQVIVTSNGTSLVSAIIRGSNCTVNITEGNLTEAASKAKNCSWTVAIGNKNTLLESGELVYLVYNLSKEVPPYSKIHFEVIPPIGAPLVAVYTVPPTASSIKSGLLDLVLGG